MFGGKLVELLIVVFFIEENRSCYVMDVGGNNQTNLMNHPGEDTHLHGNLSGPIIS